MTYFGIVLIFISAYLALTIIAAAVRSTPGEVLIAAGQFIQRAVVEQDLDGRTFTVAGEMVFQPMSGPPIKVPRGFITDLASIPRLFWNILPPFGKYTDAAILHDWLYGTKAFPRAQCDAFLLAAMEALNVPCWQHAVIFYAVRLFGWWAYNHENPKRWIPLQTTGKEGTAPCDTTSSPPPSAS